MVGTWFKERFRLIRDDLQNYEWKNKRWEQKATAPLRRVYDYVIRQKFSDNAKVDLPPDMMPDKTNQYISKKAYVVWYSGFKYDVRREISINYWEDHNEPVSEAQAEGWLDKAIKQALGDQGMESLRAWNGFTYKVNDASKGIVVTSLDNHQFNLMDWAYTKNEKVVRSGQIYK